MASVEDEIPETNMRELWNETFEEIFQDFHPDEWKLEPTETAMPRDWKTFSDNAKVSFVCHDCVWRWTSMKGKVRFWFKVMEEVDAIGEEEEVTDETGEEEERVKRGEEKKEEERREEKGGTEKERVEEGEAEEEEKEEERREEKGGTEKERVEEEEAKEEEKEDGEEEEVDKEGNKGVEKGKEVENKKEEKEEKEEKNEDKEEEEKQKEREGEGEDGNGTENEKTAQEKDRKKTTRICSLRFKLYGQKCEKCSATAFKTPIWYEDEVDKVLRNVHQKIGEVFYGFPPKEPDSKKRGGDPRRSHNASLCEACQRGECNGGYA